MAGLPADSDVLFTLGSDETIGWALGLVHPHPIQSRSLQRIVLVEPYAACLGSKAKQNEPALEGFITKNKAHPPYLFKALHGLSSRFSLS